jgi:hypothetical protein
MTRKEKFELQRKREKENGIGGAGLKVVPSSEVECDQCRTPSGTLYKIGDRMLCIQHVPTEMTTNRGAMKLLSAAASGSDAIHKMRRQLTASH